VKEYWRTESEKEIDKIKGLQVSIIRSKAMASAPPPKEGSDEDDQK